MIKVKYKNEFIGETLGTFILVLFGWGKAAFPDQSGEFFLVYILAPLIGGTIASLFFVKVLEPVMKNATGKCSCKIDNSKKV